MDANYTCGLPPDFPPSLNIPPAISYVQASIALVTGIVGLLLNAFILIIIIKYRSLHQRLMYIAIQIIVVEIAYSLLVPPAIFVSGIARDWLLGEAMCNILGIINDGFAYFRFMMTFILTLDRFVSVFFPFVYERNSKKILIILLIMVYFTTFLRVILPLKGVMGCYTYVPTNKICTAYSDCSTGCYYFVLASVVTIVLIGAIIPFCMYMILFYKAYKVRKISSQAVTTHSPSPSFSSIATVQVNMSTIKGSLPRGRESSICEHDLEKSRKSISGDENFQVTLTMFILLMSVIGCTSPAFVLYIVQFISLHNNSAFFIVIMLLGRTSFNSIPIFDAIAIMRDKQFRSSAKTFLGTLRKCI
ncbi:PREDICTED: melanopsin-B-like isoform X2 [Amphimedon queenslandica]|uniref:G-protein coupled receptors family 1 profile domain-containing protein n=1 Tax=Amphimedon queenslandica TaxID=400682 RepID=A0A1X7V814_AMPQE|nr:PREDICTED: melanopsin-B-like isoform X2 [Amphimedon queenslandica]|eukprot:XP_011402977.1 PREDICTED: melanopsin-B-like isoform X2 [Amphimedon queenslandica]